VLLVGGGTVVGVIFFGVVRFLLGEPVGTALYLLRVALLTGAYNAILTPLFFPIIRRVVESSRTRRVFRW